MSEMPLLESMFSEKIREIDDRLRNLEEADREADETSGRKMLIASKAATVIMLYGFVEEVASETFALLQRDIESRKLRYAQLAPKVQEAWLSHEFSYVATEEVGHSFYLRKARNILTAATSSPITFGGRGLLGSANVDGDKINKCCARYGVCFDTRDMRDEMAALTEIRESRNSLAHGDVSFYEYGRGVTVDDLRKKRDKVFAILEYLVAAMKDYINNDKHTRV